MTERRQPTGRKVISVPVRPSAERDKLRQLGVRSSVDHYYDSELRAHVWQLCAVCPDGRVLGARAVVSDQEMLAARHPAELVEARLDSAWAGVAARCRG